METKQKSTNEYEQKQQPNSGESLSTTTDLNKPTKPEQENDPVKDKTDYPVPTDQTKTDMLNPMMDGKDRIVPATDDQKKQYAEKSKMDDPALKSAALMHVITNTTIGALASVTNITPLSNVPLSTYSFGKTDRTTNSGYGMTPFFILTEVPQLFRYETLYNATQQANLPDKAITSFSAQDINDTIKKSIDVFNISTMTVRLVLNESIGAGKIIDPNNISDGSINLQTLERSALVNPQTSVNFVENRIFSLLSAFIALDNALIQIPKKTSSYDTFTGSVVVEALSRMPFFENMHPHPYYSVFSNLPQWAKDYFDQAFSEVPLRIGDNVITTYRGKKLSQYNQLVIDQFTAAVLRLNFDKLRNNLLSTDVIQQKIRASLIANDDVQITLLADSEEFTLLYDFTPVEYDLYLFNVLTSSSLQKEITDFLVVELEKTNRLSLPPIEEVWHQLLASETVSTSFNNNWLNSINIGNARSPYEMLVFETFADFYRFDLNWHTTPRGLEAITEVINIYTFMILFPKITQRVIHRIGYRLTKLFSILYPQIYTKFQITYGDIRTGYGSQKSDKTFYAMTEPESQGGYIYSIFLEANRLKVNKASKNDRQTDLLNQFTTLTSQLRELVIPTAKEITLDPKRIARYPYLYDNYTAYPSWNQAPDDDYLYSQTSEIGARLARLLELAESMKNLYTTTVSDQTKLPAGFVTYYATWIKAVSSLYGTAGSAFQGTMAKLQTTLFNTPFFVGSTYNPNPDRFFYVAKDIGIGPLNSAPLHAIVVPPKLQVTSFKVNIATNFALALEGEYLRNNLHTLEAELDARRLQNRIKTGMGPLNGVECFKKANSLLTTSRKFGFAMQVTQWLTTPNDPDNPLGALVKDIARFMQMSTWTPLVKKVFALFNQDFDTMFSGRLGNSAIVLDGRSLDRTLILVDPTTSMAITNPPLNSRFGRKFDYMVPYDISKLIVLSKPLLSLNSKIMKIHSGWYFGKLFVDEMGPTQLGLSNANWTDETTFNKDFIINRVSYRNGQATQINYRSDIDNTLKSMILPFTSKSVPILLIKCDYTSQLKSSYFSELAKAIEHGKIILYIANFKIKVTIEDMPSRTQDYSDPQMSHADILNILRIAGGSIFERTFRTTHYASNFISYELVQTGYIQWFATEEFVDKNIHTSTITNAIERPAQTIFPTADELGFGPDPNGLTFRGGMLKVKSDLINYNNEIPTVSPDLLTNISMTIIPSLPQHMGAY